MSVEFEVALQHIIDGVNLVIHKGAIQEIRAARLQIGGALRVREATLVELPVLPIDLPLSYRLKEACPIKINLSRKELSAPEEGM